MNNIELKKVATTSCKDPNLIKVFFDTKSNVMHIISYHYKKITCQILRCLRYMLLDGEESGGERGRGNKVGGLG